MAKVNYGVLLAGEYRELYKSCQTDVLRFDDVDVLVSQIEENRLRYEDVENAIGVPWFVVAAIHSMESGLNFETHLHNGDSLQARTVHVPAGRPKKGEAPFAWEESAVDALRLRQMHRVRKWTLSRILYELEGYNGWGYRLYHPYVLSPYLWAGSNHYSRGKYVADGRWSDSAKSKQLGAALILRRLEEIGVITLEQGDDSVLFNYSTKVEDYAVELQVFLNGFAGITLRVDGWPGKKTSDAVKKLFGFYLHGDPRA